MGSPWEDFVRRFIMSDPGFAAGMNYADRVARACSPSQDELKAQLGLVRPANPFPQPPAFAPRPTDQSTDNTVKDGLLAGAELYPQVRGGLLDGTPLPREDGTSKADKQDGNSALNAVATYQ